MNNTAIMYFSKNKSYVHCITRTMILKDDTKSKKLTALTWCFEMNLNGLLISYLTILFIFHPAEDHYMCLTGMYVWYIVLYGWYQYIMSSKFVYNGLITAGVNIIISLFPVSSTQIHQADCTIPQPANNCLIRPGLSSPFISDCNEMSGS